MVEWSIESTKHYDDAFNEVDVDVVFTSAAGSWRVPAFWRGASTWTVRFAPPSPGTYRYHLESSDRNNRDLNGHPGKVLITPYAGDNPLLRHGMLRVSKNKRFFEYADGTPFYWLADTWWAGLSDRLPWEGFQELTADRRAKGFTVIQLAAGLVPMPEEVAPIDPGYRNEGGAVWDPRFKRINPAYFDYADRRIQHLLEAGLVPAIVGGWREVLAQMGESQMKKHWRYLIARYGAYPVFWIAGGEVFDPPPPIQRKLAATPLYASLHSPGWTQIVRYIRDTDPYHHPLTVHTVDPPYDVPVQDESLTDFELFQAGHRGWPSVATEVARLDTHYSRTDLTKPLIVGEIGYEGLGGVHLEDFQRTAFWLGMLNGAAGHSYGAVGTWMSYSADRPLQRLRFSFLSWREGMNLPGSYQIGLGARLLQKYEWWNFRPHPEWIAPHGTTLLEPRSGLESIDIDLVGALSQPEPPGEEELPLGEWNRRKGNFRLPYAAGIPGRTRVIYIPYFGFKVREPPTVLGLEEGVRYHAYYWDPSLGITFDLGTIQRPTPGPVLFQGRVDPTAWEISGKWSLDLVNLSVTGSVMGTMRSFSAADLFAALNTRSGSNAGIVLRFHGPNNYLAALYSPRDKSLCLVEHAGASHGQCLGETYVGSLDAKIHLQAEVRGSSAIASVTDGTHTYTTPIVSILNTAAGTAGFVHEDDGESQEFDALELRGSPVIATDDRLERRLYDSNGEYRGELSHQGNPQPGVLGLPDWNDFGKTRHLLLDAYQPEHMPYFRDWVLVLETEEPRAPSH